MNLCTRKTSCLFLAFVLTTVSVGQEVITPIFSELQPIAGEGIIDIQPGDGIIEALLGPDGDVTTIVRMAATEIPDQRFALIKSPNRSPDILLRQDVPLVDFGLDEIARSVDYIEPGKAGDVVIRGRDSQLHEYFLSGKVNNLSLLGYHRQEYQSTKVLFGAVYSVRFSPLGELAITGCVQSSSPNCLDHVWLNSIEPQNGFQLTGATPEGLPSSQDISITAELGSEEFRYNRDGQILMDVKLNDGSDALVLIDGSRVLPVVVEGDSVVGLPSGEVFTSLIYADYLANDGWAAASVELEGGNIGPNESIECLVAGRDGEMKLVARTETGVPGRTDVIWAFFDSPVVSDTGIVYFIGSSIRLDFSEIFVDLWSWESGVLKVVASGRQLIDGKGETDQISVDDLILGPDGNLYYTFRPLGAGDDSLNEIWMYNPAESTSTLVVAPGGELLLPDGTTGVVTSATISSAFVDSGVGPGVQFDDSGRFLANLQTSVDSSRIDCVALIDPSALGDPDPATIRIHRVMSPAPDSVNEGLADHDALLRPRTAISLLDDEPIVGRGLVADGVTPLLISIERTGEIDERFTEFGLKAEVVDTSGDITLADGSKNELTSILHWFEVGSDFNNGSWKSLRESANNSNTLPPEGDDRRRYAYLEGISSDSIAFRNGSTQIEVLLTLYPTASPSEIIGQRSIFVRKPPITLVHGYNTNGAWGTGFKQTLSQTRTWNESDSSDNFVRTVTYGQEKPIAPSASIAGLRQTIAQYWWGTLGFIRELTGMEGLSRFEQGLDEGLISHDNTILPLTTLVPMLNESLVNDLGSLRGNWAFTRHDIVAHSQGGLLTRMLASERGIAGSHPSFQSLENFYRGRFHRAITIGSPHNGSRLLSYLLMLDRNESWAKILPKGISSVAVFSGLAQDKFDCFGPQIRNLNSSTRWKPDEDAMFHLVRTRINGGGAPDADDETPVAVFLGLNTDKGSVILPRGSDGIVDFDSMGALGPNQAAPANIYSLPTTSFVSHSGPAALFSAYPNGPFAIGQVASPEVAAHVHGALEQTNGAVFGKFVVPQLLSETVRKEMLAFAESQRTRVDRTTAALAGSAVALQYIQSKQDPDDPTRELVEFLLEVDNPASPVYWWLEEYGGSVSAPKLVAPPQVNAGRGDGSSVLATETRSISVSVPADYVGDLTLRAFYTNSADEFVPSATSIVVSRPPDLELVEISVLPGTASLNVGTVINPRILSIYEDDSVFPQAGNSDTLTMVSSNSAIVDVSDPNNWKMIGPGSATVTTSYQEISFLSELEVIGTVDILDSDKDGVVDLLEEAFGMNSQQWDESRLPQFSANSQNENSHIVGLEFSVSTEVAVIDGGIVSADGFLYTVELSDDLQNWSTVQSLTVTQPETDEIGVRATVRADLDASGRPFVRVRVSK